MFLVAQQRERWDNLWFIPLTSLTFNRMIELLLQDSVFNQYHVLYKNNTTGWGMSVSSMILRMQINENEMKAVRK